MAKKKPLVYGADGEVESLQSGDSIDQIVNIVASGTTTIAAQSDVLLATIILSSSGNVPYPNCFLIDNLPGVAFGTYSISVGVYVYCSKTVNQNEYVIRGANSSVTTSRTIKWKVFEI